MYFIDKTNKAKRAYNSRSEDFKHLEKDLKDSSPEVRKASHKAISQIKSELHNKKMLSMRQSLIDAHRNNDHNEIKDINDYVSKRKKYQHE